MSTSFKKKHTKFTFKSLIRFSIFCVIVFFIITFISGQKINSTKNIDPTVFFNEEQSNFILGKTTEIGNDIYNSIPPKSREQLKNLNQIPAVILIQEKIDFLKQESIDFPQKQIKEIQKMVVDRIYQNAIKTIDSQ